MKKIVLVGCFALLSALCKAQLQRLNSASPKSNGVPLLRLAEEKLEPLTIDTSTTRYYANPAADIISSKQLLIDRIDKIIQMKEDVIRKGNETDAEVENIRSLIGLQNAGIKKTLKDIEKDSAKMHKEDPDALNDLKRQVELKAIDVKRLSAKLNVALLEKRKIEMHGDELDKDLRSLQRKINEDSVRLHSVIAQKTGEISKLSAEVRKFNYLLYQIDSAKYVSFLSSLKDTLQRRKALLDKHKAALALENFVYKTFPADSAGVVGALGSMNALSRKIGEIQTRLDVLLEPELIPLEKEIKVFSDISQLFSFPEIPFTKLIDSIIKPQQVVLNSHLGELLRKLETFSKDYNAYAGYFNTTISQFNAALKGKKHEEGSDLSVLGKITSPLNNNSMLIPGFDILAGKKFADSNLAILGQAKFFFASGNSDTNKLSNGTKLFVPEASSLGFTVDFTFGFDLITYKPKNALTYSRYHSLGISVGLYYLQKQLTAPDKESSPFSIGTIQTRIGIEKTIVRNGLAVFANINGFFVGKGNEKFNTYYDDKGKMNWFVETGIKSYLKLTKDEKTNISFELRFIPVNSTVRKYANTDDKFIPLINVAVVRDFNF